MEAAGPTTEAHKPGSFWCHQLDIGYFSWWRLYSKSKVSICPTDPLRTSDFKKNVQGRGILQLNFLFLLFLLKTISGCAIIALFNIAIHKIKSSFSIEKINVLIKIFNKIKWGREKFKYRVREIAQSTNCLLSKHEFQHWHPRKKPG